MKNSKKKNEKERNIKNKNIVKKKRRKWTVCIDKEKMKARGFLKKEKGKTDNEKKEETITCEASEQVQVSCSILLCLKFDEKRKE